ncbi:MAG TPA: hypothetical protein K8V30_07850 [Metalysinibacillus jejuensis]|uniref:Lipoprotein n=1 Tax=Metalysinibacillus jejuensis TaxID=914327 RepID=A0A921NBU2_9BACL|nr:hypothetical protein [Metalysinibacillus jejuensis]HJH11576.1 hypothetical protein [Metalysinibacillus jejuensis]
MLKKTCTLLLFALVLSACSSTEDKEKEVISAYLTAKYSVTPDTTIKQLNEAVSPYITATLAEEQDLQLAIDVAQKYDSPLQVVSISAVPLDVSGEYRYVVKLSVADKPVEQRGELSVDDEKISYDQHKKKN